MKFNDVAKAVNFRISGSTRYLFKAYGENVYIYDYLDMNDKPIGSFVASNEGNVLEVCVEVPKEAVCYRWIDSEYRKASEQEHESKAIDFTIAWDDVKYIDITEETDMLEKVAAIRSGLPFNKQIVHVQHMSDKEFLSIAKKAHEKNITFNEMVNLILRQLPDVTAKTVGTTVAKSEDPPVQNFKHEIHEDEPDFTLEVNEIGEFYYSPVHQELNMTGSEASGVIQEGSSPLENLNASTEEVVDIQAPDAKLNAVGSDASDSLTIPLPTIDFIEISEDAGNENNNEQDDLHYNFMMPLAHPTTPWNQNPAFAIHGVTPSVKELVDDFLEKRGQELSLAFKEMQTVLPEDLREKLKVLDSFENKDVILAGALAGFALAFENAGENFLPEDAKHVVENVIYVEKEGKEVAVSLSELRFHVEETPGLPLNPEESLIEELTNWILQALKVMPFLVSGYQVGMNKDKKLLAKELEELEQPDSFKAWTYCTAKTEYEHFENLNIELGSGMTVFEAWMSDSPIILVGIKYPDGTSMKSRLDLQKHMFLDALPSHADDTLIIKLVIELIKLRIESDAKPKTVADIIRNLPSPPKTDKESFNKMLGTVNSPGGASQKSSPGSEKKKSRFSNF